jgi:hypothetical protein
MRYVVQVMTMGDMSPAGLSHAYYNSPDGEPEDIVVQTMGVYNSLEQASENSLKDYTAFVDEHGDMEESGCWMQCVGVEEDEYLDYMATSDAFEHLTSDELYAIYEGDDYDD